MYETKLHDWAALGGGVRIVLSRCKWGAQRAPDTKVRQGPDFHAPTRCELSPVSPTRAKHRGPRKPAWIGLVPCVPCVPYRKTGCRSRAAWLGALIVTGLRVYLLPTAPSLHASPQPPGFGSFLGPELRGLFGPRCKRVRRLRLWVVNDTVRLVMYPL